MPYEWVDPEIYLEHDEVVIYHVYKDDDFLNSGPRTYWFCLEACESMDNGDKTFDVRSLPHWDPNADLGVGVPSDDEYVKGVIRKAIDAGFFADWEKDSPEPEGLGRKYADLAWHVGDITGMTKLSDAEAEEWLVNNQKYIRDRLCELGNEVIETLLQDSGIAICYDNEEVEEPTVRSQVLSYVATTETPYRRVLEERFPYWIDEIKALLAEGKLREVGEHLEIVEEDENA